MNKKLMTYSLLITGNVLGVGVLATPIKTGLSGFYPTLCGIVLIWFAMCITALIIANRIEPNTADSFDIPSFFHQHLGRWAYIIAVIANLILLYGVLTAYLSGIANIIANIFSTHLPKTMIVLIYFIILCGLLLRGMKALRRGNLFIICALWVCFLVLLITAAKHFNPSHLVYHNWLLFSAGLPILVSAFHFHNIVPTVCHGLDYDKRQVKYAIFLGTGVGLVINILWVLVVLGGLPIASHQPNSILTAFLHNSPATVPLSRALHSGYFTTAGLIFALLAVTASFMANGTGLLGFVRDLTTSYFKTGNKVLVASLSLLPPLLISLIYPDIFLKAIGVVGGIGETILFGILPAFILLKIKTLSPKMKYLAWAVLILTTYILIYEVGVRIGMIPVMT